MLYRYLLITGMLFLLLSIYHFSKSIAFADIAKRANGTVTEMSWESDGDGTTYFPIFAIHTKDKGEIAYAHSVRSNPPSWQVGDTAPFLYDPAGKYKPRIRTYTGLFGWSIFFLIPAIPLLILALLTYLHRFKWPWLIGIVIIELIVFGTAQKMLQHYIN